ncbi:fatty acid/phospholipid synthesis protein PlsX [Gottschalkia acidurici 9a]|uniref:Phosphate acyltransferase n=1 Tax=Gottschalkia acidurici (strain ATCC 7906 / DSM 604 / BCRC 14475 / CIP 104303 / KCTC 5404 / NCIMB 10678 / 9a) TaxID=1128398 RepID=K0AZE8_GOTA9|nr:phosphate acyltransferase PlsX [Gottschalkia acidurici]AFS78644.1 fatty acid/phospholipid synthesis protein PlsX [Gottschalkia acidurici 9a]
MIIAVDAMGGDEGLKVTVKGSIDAINELGVKIVLVGKESLIKEQLNKYKYDVKNIEIVNADEIITNEDEPAMAIRKKKDSSMVVGLNLLKEKKVDAFISSGNTGALLSGGLLLVKRIKGIERPALATVYPTKKGVSLLLDVGANADSKPKYLQQFAIMGSIYSEKILNRKKPKVGLVNIGAEKGKGNDLVKETYEILENTEGINFCGNTEGRDIPNGDIDVLVCDGFVGNIILKLTEGLGLSIFSMLKDTFMESTMSKIGALILKPGLKKFKKQLDYSEYGGAPLLGVKGAVIKAHGSSNDIAIKNAIKQAKLFVENGVIEKIEENIAFGREQNE